MWSRREAVATALPLDLWPKVQKAALRSEDVEKYESNELAMRLYFESVSYTHLTLPTILLV